MCIYTQTHIQIHTQVKKTWTESKKANLGQLKLDWDNCCCLDHYTILNQSAFEVYKSTDVQRVTPQGSFTFSLGVIKEDDTGVTSTDKACLCWTCQHKTESSCHKGSTHSSLNYQSSHLVVRTWPQRLR